MKYGRLALAVCLLAFAFGCSSNDEPRVPSCDDQRVKDLLQKIVASNGIELASLSDIATESSSPEECLCEAKAKIKYDGMEREGPFQYSIKLDASKEDFTVRIIMDEKGDDAR
ncbi:MAG: hypothetical protein HDQ93_06345 [Desulfovibrio sp.]|nr:hypothetical protein [Desulfovibrio sp.]